MASGLPMRQGLRSDSAHKLLGCLCDRGRWHDLTCPPIFMSPACRAPTATPPSTWPLYMATPTACACC